MLIRKGFRYRIYPNTEQREALAIQLGHSRFVYNWALDLRRKTYRDTGKGLTYFDTNWTLTKLKKIAPWLCDADSQILQEKLRDLQRAYVNFFEGRAKYPNFKSKHHPQSIRYPQRFKVEGNRVYLPKVGWVRAVFHCPLEGKMKNCTVTKTKSGKYFISIQCEVKIPDPEFSGPAVGIDVGLTRYATLSKPLPDGRTEIEHPEYLRKAEKKLARLQRRLSRCQKGSKGREKARLAVARQHEKVANQRQDFLHKESRKIVDAFGLIGLETLNIKGMVRNHRLAKSISDSGWYRFSQFITYKGQWYGSHIERFDRFYPSSRLCSTAGCGYINRELELGQSFWICPDCGKRHDRDGNASHNLEPTITVGAPGIYADGDRVRPATLLCVEGTVVEVGSPTL